MITVIANCVRATQVLVTLYVLSLVLTAPEKYILLVVVIRQQCILLRSQGYESLISCPPCLTAVLLAL